VENADTNELEQKPKEYEFIKCDHCQWIDYLNKQPKRCPKCGSGVDKVNFTLFDHESITLDMQNTRAEWHKLTVTFREFSKRFEAIMGDELKNQMPNEAAKNRMEFMIKVYVWILLKYAPYLWTYIDIPISGLKEIVLMMYSIKMEDFDKLKSKLQEISKYVLNVEKYLEEKGL